MANPSPISESESRVPAPCVPATPAPAAGARGSSQSLASPLYPGTEPPSAPERITMMRNRQNSPHIGLQTSHQTELRRTQPPQKIEILHPAERGSSSMTPMDPSAASGANASPPPTPESPSVIDRPPTLTPLRLRPRRLPERDLRP